MKADISTLHKPDILILCRHSAEKQYGPDTAFLEQTLTREAKTLRTLGRPEEAAKMSTV